MHFTLKQLRYFVTAGQFGSVTRAAETLHVSQPSISSAILHLEEITGLQLFVRHHAQGLSLTPAGKQFILKAKQLLSDAEGLGRYASSLGEEVSGSLRIVGFPTFTPILIPLLMRRFVEAYPDVNIYCDEAHQKDIIQNMYDGRYELAVTYDLQVPSDIEFEPLLTFAPYAVLPVSHPLSSKESLSLSDLVDLPMVYLDWPMTRDYFFSLFLSQDLEPNFAYPAQSLEMVRSLVANGFGYTLFNTPLINNHALDGGEMKAMPLIDNLRPLCVGVAKIAHFRLTPAASAFVDMLKSYSEDMSSNIFSTTTASSKKGNIQQ
ncbi:LysR substrate-binding domain-containing protein [Grimontia sp. NTOU-MAR1]|uniref:LysR substrate-binding domain-containing protein n=1 Tax=Grimontia sp. NTOU-MAR1 TaxID=3111011 RepID=UPI002DB68EFE|nr:LysR substrate-binding domain-containing protein [Grimontia sp. NTOU-MAR1]WRW00841.1 LysR substrate-binding domain-containing protein [Grimontia sp. NTOU-MAR1]